MLVVPLSLLLIFLLLFATFNSIRQAALVFTGIPLATVERCVRAAASWHAFQYLGRCRLS